MQGAGWISLFRRIPTSQHNCLILMTVTGMEIVLQRLIRLDHDFLVALGRLSGSTDQGKVLVIPYDQMTYLTFSKVLTDAEVEAMVGKPGVAVAANEGDLAADAADEASAPTAFPAGPASEAVAEELRPAPVEVVPHNGAAARATHRQAPPSKTILLARLRERLAGDIAKQTGS